MSDIKYKFILSESANIDDLELDSRHIEHVITGEQYLPDLVDRFEEWLRGCGYIFDHIELYIGDETND